MPNDATSPSHSTKQVPKEKPTLVVLSGSGMSAESGLKTFRDNDGLWENHRVEEVATPEAWRKNRSLVLRFYNERRRQLITAEPNEGHRLIAEWEKHFRVLVVTQNVDDLHERAGSTKVLHLHGSLRHARSTRNPELVVPIDGWEIKEGDLCPEGSQLRPHIVWFGEAVTAMPEAYDWIKEADIFVVVGTSLQVHPAASLAYMLPAKIPHFLIDPNPPEAKGFRVIKAGASAGLRELGGLLEEFR